MTSTLIKYNVILIVLCIGITLIHNSSEAIVKEDVILYYNHLSPQCRSVLLTLGALDLKITLKSINLLKGDQLPEKFRKINSLQTVPVLQDDKITLFESDAINVHLVEKYGDAKNLLYPSVCGRFRSKINQTLIFIKINFYSAFEILSDRRISRGIQITTEVGDKIYKALNYFENSLKTFDNAVGWIITVADFALLASISTVEVVGFDLGKYEKIQSWLERCKTGMASYYTANQSGIYELKSLLESTVKEDVILYYNHLSPQCRSVLLTLKALDLKITLKSIDLLKGEQLPEEFRKINSLQTVPVLVDGDLVLFESHIIIVYLVQQYGGVYPSLYPKDPKIQAQVNQILNFEKRTLYPAFKNEYNPGTLRGILNLKEVENKIYKVLDSLEETLGKSDWAVGKIITVADFALVASISTFDAIDSYIAVYKNIQNWFKNCKDKMKYYEANEKGIDEIVYLLGSKLSNNRESRSTNKEHLKYYEVILP